MSDTVIRIEGLSKRYQIQTTRTKGAQEDFRQLIQDSVMWPVRKAASAVGLRRFSEPQNSGQDSFYALKDVSFDVKQGEVVGIIGKNGAGKSTLLKVLSRITEPTSGRIGVNGRIASLLEVGTGFHPELTGRENVYLNGAVLGMTRAEVRSKFDEIVDFAGVEKFLETPVKRYSSGMYVRLAFAVAAHLEPEILVIDEVLAVGDAEFQKKCLGKMQHVAKSGRTVLFVSHNLGMVSSLCDRVVLLEQGQLVADQPAADGVLTYFTRGRSSPFHVRYEEGEKRPSGLGTSLLSARIENAKGQPTGVLDIAESFTIRMRYRVEEAKRKAPFANFHVHDSAGNALFVTAPSGQAQRTGEVGDFEAVCTIPGRLLNSGVYFIGLGLMYSSQGIESAFLEKDALCVNLHEDIDANLHGERNGYAGNIPGLIRPQLEWRVERV